MSLKICRQIGRWANRFDMISLETPLPWHAIVLNHYLNKKKLAIRFSLIQAPTDTFQITVQINSLRYNVLKLDILTTFA